MIANGKVKVGRANIPHFSTFIVAVGEITATHGVFSFFSA